MPKMFRRDGVAVDLPPEAVLAELGKPPDKRELFFQHGQRLNVLSEIGEPYTIAQEELGKALSAGWALEPPEAIQARAERSTFGTLGEALKAGAESVLSGGSLGLSDVAFADMMGDEYREARARRERVFPALTSAATLTGAIAPLIFTGPVGVGGTALRFGGAAPRAAASLARAGEAATTAGLRTVGITGESLAGRAFQKGASLAVGGAIEGSLFAAGQRLSEASLAPGGDYERLAEKLLVGAKEGALFGAAAGGALGLTAGAIAAGARRGVRALAGPQGLQATLERFANERTFKALGGRLAEANRLGTSAEAVQASMARMGRTLRELKLEDGSPIFRAGDKAEDLVPRLTRARDEIAPKLDEIADQVDDFAKGRPDLEPDLPAMLRVIDDQVVKPLGGSLLPDLRRMAGQVQRRLQGIRAMAESGIPMSTRNLRDFRRELDRVIFPKPITPGVRPLPPRSAEALLQVRGIVERTVEESIERTVAEMDPLIAGAYKRTKEQFSAVQRALEISGKASLRDIANRVISPTDYFTGGVGALANIATGGTGMGAVVKGAGVAAVHRMIRERGASVLAVLAGRLAKSERVMDDTVRGYMKTAGDLRRVGIGVLSGLEERRTARGLRLAKGENRGDAYARAVGEVKNFHPEATVPADVMLHNPKTGAALQTVTARGAAYLASQAPTATFAQQTTAAPHLDPNRPDDYALRQFALQVRAVQNPATVLDGLKRRQVTPAEMRAFRAVYPSLYDELRDKIHKALLGLERRPPYLDRVQLGLLFPDLVTDRSMLPEAIRITQQSYRTGEAHAAPTPSPLGSRTTAIAKKFQSTTQRLEAGDYDI